MNMNRFLSILLVTGALGLTARAAAPTGWTDNYAKAVETAKTEKKYVLLDFTGSDWCGYCKLLDKEVFGTPHFKEWAKKNVVLVTVDFPHQTPLSAQVKKQNGELKAKYPTNGYPTILILDTEGKELVREVGYHPGSGANEYVGKLEAAMKKAGATPSADAGGGSNPGKIQEPSIFKTTPKPF
jgi:thioredoxin-related protein